LKYVNDWYWPDGDVKSHVANHDKMLSNLKYVLGFVSQKRVCIQAGGAVGMWPHFLSKHFEQVYTFEADSEQFDCLRVNVRAENITAFHAALGRENGSVGVVHDQKRCNASYVVGQTAGNPRARCYTLDSMDFDVPVGFICLDLEGYEFFALQGAEKLLRQHSPVVQVENKHYNRYGLQKHYIGAIMGSFGYSLIHTNKYDEVYAKK